MTDIVERLNGKLDPGDTISQVIDDAKSEIRTLRAEIEMLRSVLQKLRWKSIDKDNMEFRCDITCYVMDEIRRALEQKP